MLSTKLGGALVALAFGVLAVAQDASADIYIVRNANSSGPDSLRDRIKDANNHPGHDTIGFRIPDPGPHTITPLNAPLPTITDSVTIDGYSEPDSLAPTDVSPAVIQVAINATNHGVGLEVAADDSTIRGLSIHSDELAAQTADAIRIVNGNGNRVEGNYLGLDPTGADADNVSTGVETVGDDNVVGGSADEDRNVIAGNDNAGVVLLGDGNRVRGNSIGTDPDVTEDLGNDVGVWIDDGVGNTVTDNILSGNEVGVRVGSGTGNEVHDNLIGTNATGDGPLVPNFFGGETGVEVQVPASDTDIAGNVVGGTASEGVLLAGNDNTVRDNRLGTDGSVELLSMRGVKITGDRNTVGGSAEGDANLISGNELEGVEFRADPVTDDPSEDNTVEGNLIGTDPEGDAPLPNGDDGIEIIDANDNDIVDNVISGNDGNGVRIRVDDTPDADGNRLVGNAIGTDADGALDLGNGGAGVRIEEGADQNEVGPVDAADGANTIAFNDEDGVAVVDGTGNTIVRNSMFANTDLGIDLGDDGPTDNDIGDVDTGSNEFVNFPELTGATTTTVDWQIIDGLLNQFVQLDFYTCDGDEGRTYLGTAAARTDGNGDASGTAALTTPAAVGDLVTATVTNYRLAGGFPPILAHDETSEFSACVTVS